MHSPKRHKSNHSKLEQITPAIILTISNEGLCNPGYQNRTSLNNDDKQTKAITLPSVASVNLTTTPNNTTNLRYHILKQILHANKDNVKRQLHYNVCLPLFETCKLNKLKLSQAPCLMTVSNENEDMCYSEPLCLVKLSNEHGKCNLNDDEEQTRT